MTRRARHPVALKVYDPSGTDAHGNPVAGYLPPVEFLVYGIGPRYQTEPATGRMEVVEGLNIFAPVTAPRPTPYDRLVIDGVDYEVIGDVADYTRGPYGSRQGVTYEVKKVDG